MMRRQTVSPSDGDGVAPAGFEDRARIPGIVSPQGRGRQIAVQLLPEPAGPKGPSHADSEVVHQLDHPRGQTPHTTTSIAPRGDRRRAQPEVFRPPPYPDVPPAPRRRAGLTVPGYPRSPGPLPGP